MGVVVVKNGSYMFNVLVWVFRAIIALNLWRFLKRIWDYLPLKNLHFDTMKR